MQERELSPEVFDGCCLGWTIPSRHCFYGGPWVAGLMGLERVPAAILSQACATGVRCIAYSSQEIQTKSASVYLAITTDHCSNGPHIYYPRSDAQGGTGPHEDWVLDNFGYDPFAKKPMFVTAENVAKKAGIGREIQEEITVMRYQAYERAGIGVADIKAMTSHTPFAVNDAYLSKELGIDLKDMNRYGCSLIWGHPQAPTGMRGVIELIEELAILGGGYGLFTGCAAGDSGAALVVKVDVS